MISYSTQLVMKILRQNAFDAYLVGGCVRDLLLKKTPKDFDVVTTASLKQIKNQFHNCLIVGQRYPICRVKIKGETIEVSSFDTIAKHSKVKKSIEFSQLPTICDNKDFIRWKNCMERDFTINGLFFDPFACIIYDYAGGIKDLKMFRVQTVIPAHVSFKEDCARILRASRIAARLGLRFSKETAAAINDHSSSLAKLDKSRLMMELNFMLAYGSAESSLCLLQRFRLLEIMLPMHGSYLDGQAEKQVAQESTMLMKLFSCADKLLAPDRPSNCILWVGLLAFHLALVCHPQDALVVCTFASILYYGKWYKAIKFARRNLKINYQFYPEILNISAPKSDESLLEEVSHLASLVKSSVRTLTSSSFSHGLVIIPMKTGQAVSQLLGVLENDIKSLTTERKNFDINYQLLGRGHPSETRFVLGKVIIDTMSNGVLPERKWDAQAIKRSRGSEVLQEQKQVVQVAKLNGGVLQEQNQVIQVAKPDCRLLQEHKHDVQATKHEQKWNVQPTKNDRRLYKLFI